MRYNNSIPLSVEQIESVLTSTANKIDSYSDIIRIDRKNSAFMKKQLQPSQNRFREPNEEKSAGSLQHRTIPTTHLTTAPQPSDAIKGRQAAILADGLHEITAVMKGNYNLGDVIYMILETMYRGFEFNRVIFCLMDAAKSKMAARFGLGENVDEILKHFQFLTGRSTDIFNVGISQAKGIIIDDAADPKIFKNIPEWYQQIVGASSFLILPLEVRGVCIGMFYADKKEKGRSLTDDQLNHMENLCDMAIEAITQKHPQ
jgi:transcriptional regulator with GAF, ATPase, and Fis domain